MSKAAGTGWRPASWPTERVPGVVEGSEKYGLGSATVIANPQPRTVRSFYVRHPGWLALQLALVLLSLGIGVAGLFTGMLLAVAGLVLGVVIGLAAIFVVPGWRDRVEERQ
jgi:hypothetical protein